MRRREGERKKWPNWTRGPVYRAPTLGQFSPYGSVGGTISVVRLAGMANERERE